MKKAFILLVFALISITAISQNLEFRLRGGVNFQRASTAEGDFSFLPHVGAMAGVRITSMGIYGEFLYSEHDDDSWPEPGTYFVPSLLFRYYIYRYIYSEVGLSYYLLGGEQAENSVYEYPDNKLGYFAGVGFSFKNFELGLRATNPVISIQATASFRFSL